MSDQMASGRSAEDRLKAALSGRYTIEREIDRGGMATVYLARDLKHDRQVAIKVLRDESLVEDASHRFLREIHVTAGLIHPHILPLLDSDTLDGLHYYVMPFVEGESLQKRLEREGRLPVDQAVQIASEVADALAHAHQHGLVHRDIKPGNILLEGEHVFLADFGIVRPPSSADAGLTQEGKVLGTPDYQSPEQWMGEEGLDGRSDVYSLGCVLFEMLTGEPPFQGPSPEVVAGKHLHQTPPSVSRYREDLPQGMEEVLATALAKEPDERFDSAGSFADALKTTGEGEAVRGSKGLSVARGGDLKLVAGVALILLVTALLWMGRDRIPGPWAGPTAPPDTTRYAVVPAPGEEGTLAELDAIQRIKQSLDRWNEISVADPVPLGEDGEGRLGESLADVELADLASSWGVGRMIRVSAGSMGPDFRVNAELLDVGSRGERLASSSVRIPQDLTGVDSLVAGLVDRLLFRDALGSGGLGESDTRSLASQHAFLEGWEALAAGDLPRSDSAFARSVLADRFHAEGHLWLAVTRYWRRQDPPTWRASALQAARSQDLSPRNRTMVNAVLAHGQGDPVEACSLWEELTKTEPRYFGGWLGSATCKEMDGRVVRDPNSPSGWSFRTSHHDALSDFRKAFELFPAILKSFRKGSYGELRRLFLTAANERRAGGSAAPDNSIFIAEPAWRGDSLSLVPYPVGSQGMTLTVEARELEMAVHRQRTLLHEVVLGWVSAHPSSPDAHEALAITLSILGDPNALGEIARARILAGEEGSELGPSGEEAGELRLAGVEAWLQLGFALPDDPPGVRRAKALADSVLAAEDATGTLSPLFLAGLAVLTGRAHRAGALMRASGIAREMNAPPPLRETAPVFLLYSALGGPPDTLEALELRVRQGIQESLLPEDRPQATSMWLVRPATMAFYQHPPSTIDSLAASGDWILELQAALVAHDSATVRAGVDRLRNERQGLLPSSVSLDALLSEVELMVLLGDLDDAARTLDPALRALPQSMPGILTNPVLAASLLRASALRSVVAYRQGDTEEALKWREAVATLWADADPFLQSRIAEMNQ